MNKNCRLWMGIAALVNFPIFAFAQPNPCPRAAAGSTISNPPDLYSQEGSLTVDLYYNTTTDAAGRTLYCFTTPNGTESPTLHVNPGDHLIVNVTNKLPAPASAGSMQM
ncbi:MAG TPA: hypothetical protein VI756_21855, partial [Blastocatellia bacterium]